MVSKQDDRGTISEDYILFHTIIPRNVPQNGCVQNLFLNTLTKIEILLTIVSKFPPTPSPPARWLQNASSNVSCLSENYHSLYQQFSLFIYVYHVVGVKSIYCCEHLVPDPCGLHTQRPAYANDNAPSRAT